MNWYIYKIQVTRQAMLTEGPTPDEAAILSVHADYLSKLVEQGVAVLVGRTLTTDEGTFGLCIFQAASPEEAETIMRSDPGIAAGVWRGELRPFRISFLADALPHLPA